MNIRQITESDLPEIFSWFESRKWPYPPVERIAPEWGFLAEKDSVKLACAFVYITGASIAFLDWTATNPEADEAMAVKGLVETVERIKEISSSISPPIKAMCLITQNEKLADRFEKTGFRKQNDFYRCVWVAPKN